MATRKVPISQYSSDEIGIAIFDQGNPADADAGVTLGIIYDLDQTQVVPPGTVATRDEVGFYTYRVHSSLTETKGAYTATWQYTLAGEDYTFVTTFIVNDPAPNWDSLNPDQRVMVENIYFKVSDGFDSSLNNGGGGPYLWEMPQSAFGYETIARIMRTEAMNYINFSKPKDFVPPFNIGVGVQNPFPTGYYGIIEKAAAYFLYKHLQRSYLEQPLAVGITTARMDRRDYFDRWGVIVAQEKSELDEELRMLKRRYLYGYRTRALLVAGGAFPMSYLNPARPRWPFITARF